MKHVVSAIARAGLVAGLLFTAVQAPAWAAPEAGKVYSVLPKPADTDHEVVEVVEFFSYACPHCRTFEPHLQNWHKALPKDVRLVRVPVTFDRDQWAALARMYYTLETLGEAERLSTEIFNALHLEGVNLTVERVQQDWLSKRAVDPKKYLDTYRSFTVDSKMRRGLQLAQAYQIDSVPTLGIAGRFRTSPSQAGEGDASLRVVDGLVAQVRKERAANKPEPAKQDKTAVRKKDAAVK